MVTHFSVSNKVACGRKIQSIGCSQDVTEVTCKTCRNTEAYRSAVVAATAERAPRPRLVAVSLHPSSKQSRRIAFVEWMRSLRHGERLPRGRFFACRAGQIGRNLRAYQVGGSDVVAAFDPQGAIAALCEQTGQDLDEWDISEVVPVENERLDCLEIFNQDDGIYETLKTTLRQDLARLAGPTYMYGWE